MEKYVKLDYKHMDNSQLMDMQGIEEEREGKQRKL